MTDPNQSPSPEEVEAIARAMMGAPNESLPWWMIRAERAIAAWNSRARSQAIRAAVLHELADECMAEAVRYDEVASGGSHQDTYWCGPMTLGGRNTLLACMQREFAQVCRVKAELEETPSQPDRLNEQGSDHQSACQGAEGKALATQPTAASDDEMAELCRLLRSTGHLSVARQTRDAAATLLESLSAQLKVEQAALSHEHYLWKQARDMLGATNDQIAIANEGLAASYLAGALAAKRDAREVMAEMERALEPFSEAAREFTSAIAHDGIDDGLSVIATMYGSEGREAKLSTAHFSVARAARQKAREFLGEKGR